MVHPNLIPRRLARSRTKGQRVLDGIRQIEVRWFQLHLPRLDLRQIEDVVDEGQQMSSRLQDVLQVFGLLFIDVSEHPLGEHFRESDDSVQRGPQLVGHVGEELGLVPAGGGLKLSALVRDLVEEPGILDGQGRLRREGTQQFDRLGRELTGTVTGHPETARELALADHRHREHGPDAGFDQDVPQPALVGPRHGDVGHLDRF